MSTRGRNFDTRMYRLRELVRDKVLNLVKIATATDWQRFYQVAPGGLNQQAATHGLWHARLSDS
eukprot:CAMPEP_0206233902 /NCGR_PEP_ID=MMETSP0047_2-20121206/12275_1 /ASSEMBLY_ACC=CAM_ASM_000192 /TAXON_ID=195065 /ORGANISM="Chroomonas mesostigmatica_cf, Strain CCMP1168" /LENGTH=63 /DNA_ID=CAMNT_0053657893 /DNA_START=107 /DNA_END=302 /DNA_ORIENTATION=+